MLYYSWLNRIIIPRNIYISPFHQFPGQHSGKQRPLTVCRHIWKNQYHWEVDRDTSRHWRTRQLWRRKQRQRTSKSSWKMKNNSWKSLCERHGEIFMYSEENRSRKVTSPNLESEFFLLFFFTELNYLIFLGYFDRYMREYSGQQDFFKFNFLCKGI